MGRCAACVGVVALITLWAAPAPADEPDLTRMTPKPSWTVCGEFACYTKDEQIKVVQMRAHYELVFHYAVLLRRQTELQEDQALLLRLRVRDLEASLSSARSLAEIDNQRYKEKLKQQDNANTSRLVLYTAGGVGVGILLGLLIAAVQ